MKKTLISLCLLGQIAFGGEYQELFKQFAVNDKIPEDSKAAFFVHLTKDLPYKTELDLDGSKFRAWWKENNSYSLSSLKNEGKYITFQLEDKYLVGNIFHSDIPFTFDDIHHYLKYVINYRFQKYPDITSTGLEKSRDVAYIDFESIVYGMHTERSSLSEAYKKYLDTQREVTEEATFQFENLVDRLHERNAS